MKLNSRMKRFLADVDLHHLPDLPYELEAWAGDGFFWHRNGCYFQRALFDARYETHDIEDFGDETGFECFVSKVHIDDYAPPPFLPMALAYVRRVFANQRSTDGYSDLAAIVGLHGPASGCTVRFFVERPGVGYPGTELEDYRSEAVLMMSVHDSLDDVASTQPNLSWGQKPDR